MLVHGDYGPQNVLLDRADLEITAVLDWEWAHAGHPVEGGVRARRDQSMAGMIRNAPVSCRARECPWSAT